MVSFDLHLLELLYLTNFCFKFSCLSSNCFGLVEVLLDSKFQKFNLGVEGVKHTILLKMWIKSDFIWSVTIKIGCVGNFYFFIPRLLVSDKHIQVIPLKIEFSWKVFWYHLKYQNGVFSSKFINFNIIIFYFFIKNGHICHFKGK